MESETKKALIFSLFTGITGLGLYFINEAHKEAVRKRTIIKDMKEVQTPKGVKKLKGLTEPQYTMITGVCIAKREQSEKAPHIHKDKKLYKIDYEVSLSYDRST